MTVVEQNSQIQAALVAGLSIVIADRLGNRRTWIQNLAANCGREVLVHSPVDPSTARFQLGAGLDQGQGIEAVQVARCLLNMAPEGGSGKNSSIGFWEDSASALLGACLIRFSSLGEIYDSMRDVSALAKRLGAVQDEAFLLSTAFRSSVAKDGAVAGNVAAIVVSVLTGWADLTVRKQTAAGDFGLAEIGRPGSIIVFSAPLRWERVFRGYLTACLWRAQRSLTDSGLTESVVQVLA